MADSSVTANPGTGGSKFATFLDGSSVNWPYALGAWNEGGTITEVAAATPFPVTLKTGSATIGTVNSAQSGTWNITNVSGTVSLPTGAATAAKQPALGTAGTASADVLTVQGITSMTPLLATLSGTNNIATVTTVTTVSAVTAISNALPAGTNTIGAVNVKPATAGGLTVNRVISAATTNATSVKGSAGQVFGWYISNVNAAARFVKLYNKATSPTVGSDTPVMTIAVPGNTAGAGTNVEFTNGIAFGTGIGLAITAAVTDADTTAVAANEIVVNLLYA